jgi:steroid delta-isomerase-like uncharacterized protein
MADFDKVALMRRWFQEVWNEGKTDIVLQHTDPNLVGTGQGDAGVQVKSPQDFLQFVATMRGAFPDLRVKVEDAFQSDDRVAVRWSVTGTHQGDHLGVPASGKQIAISGITIAKFRGDKIVEGWDSWDQLEMLKTIGAVEVPKARFLSAVP